MRFSLHNRTHRLALTVALSVLVALTLFNGMDSRRPLIAAAMKVLLWPALLIIRLLELIYPPQGQDAIVLVFEGLVIAVVTVYPVLIYGLLSLLARLGRRRANS